MIDHIVISNFAIIENTEISLGDGLNIITGETGSGKSMVIEALSMALGGRSDSSLVRKGEEKATINLLCRKNEEEFLIEREIFSNGKSLCKINGKLVTLGQLKEFCQDLVDIHGQYDNQLILNPDNHLSILDNYGNQKLESFKKAYQSAYTQYAKKFRQLKTLIKEQEEKLKEKSYLETSLAEMKTYELEDNEDKKLEEEIDVLENSQAIFIGLNTALQFLNQEDGAVRLTHQAANAISSISEFSSDIKKIYQHLEDTYYALDDIRTTLDHINSNLHFSPELLEEKVQRLNAINSLKERFGPSLSDVLDKTNLFQEKLSKIENFNQKEKELTVEAQALSKELKSAAEALTNARLEVASELEKEIETQLAQLNFQGPKFKISLNKLAQAKADGFDKAEFFISTNIGEDIKPLVKVASGGEISRIMLAIKHITAKSDFIPTVVFDEIDAGISGKTAFVVGKKLKSISQHRQIICITHLPQIAAFAKNSFKIYKEFDGERTKAYVSALSDSQQVEEIARMLGHDKLTDTTLANARELIESSKN